MALKCCDVGPRQPDRHFDSDRHGVIGEHEALQLFVAQIVVADGGNDDSGALSSFYVFNAMGFYPASPASPSYLIGSPLFDQITIKLNPKYYSGGQFEIQAINNSPSNPFIQSASQNGQSKTDVVLNHSDIINGGTLILNMGNSAGGWGQ